MNHTVTTTNEAIKERKKERNIVYETPGGSIIT